MLTQSIQKSAGTSDSLETRALAFAELDAGTNDMARFQRLSGLITELRPRRAGNTEQSIRAIRALCHLLESRPDFRQRFRAALLAFFGGLRATSLYVDAGLYSGHGFFGELQRRCLHKLLPEELNVEYLRDVVAALFDRPSDAGWVGDLDDTVWLELFHALQFSELGPDIGKRWMLDLVESLRVLSYRIAAIGLEPELLRIQPNLEAYESPFLGQNIEALQLMSSWQACLVGNAPDADDGMQLHVLFDQCRKVIDKVRVRASREGTSLSLTLHLSRLTQHLDRAEAILGIFAAWRETHCLEATAEATVGFCKSLVVAECRKNDLRSFWRDSVELVSHRVTEHAGRTGEHYITTSRRDYFAMFRSAALAGVVIAFMALNKIAIGKLQLAPLVDALAVCLNYGLGFVLIHILHGTVATKQPAMTANVIAAAIGDGSNRSPKARSEAFDRLALLIARTVRSQLVAVLGNVLIVVPVAIAISFALSHWLNVSFPSADKARHLLADLHPWKGGALIYAGIAGVCLFLSGLISGYYDNVAAYNRIPQRLKALRSLRRLLGEARLARVADYVENNLGALAGNFFFGFLLGGVTTFGVLFGLLVDIRHITFSAAYLGYAANALHFSFAWPEIVIPVVGVILIGTVNLVVSFTLSLWIACRSRRIRLTQAYPLLGHVFALLKRQPREFFLPPKQ